MAVTYKKKIAKRDIPSEFEEKTRHAITRIEGSHSVVGVLYMRNEQGALTKNSSYKMKIISNLLKDYRDEWLVRTTALINTVNPIIDRIMEDESVGGVIMTNKEGAPIITNMTVMGATNYGLALNKFGYMAQNYIKELV